MYGTKQCVYSVPYSYTTAWPVLAYVQNNIVYDSQYSIIIIITKIITNNSNTLAQSRTHWLMISIKVRRPIALLLAYSIVDTACYIGHYDIDELHQHGLNATQLLCMTSKGIHGRPWPGDAFSRSADYSNWVLLAALRDKYYLFPGE